MAEKSQKTREISHRYIIPKSISCALTANTAFELTVLQCSISKMVKKRKEKQWLLYYLWPSWLGILSQPWRPSRLGSLCRTGVGLTQPGTLPSVEPFSKFYCLLWGPECWVWSRPLRVGAIIMEPPLHLALGVPAQASFLRVQPPRHIGTLSSVLWTQKGLVWMGCLCAALREKEVRLKPLGVCSGTFHSNSKDNFP